MSALLTAERLRELLHYDPLTGVFTRLVRTCNSVHIGDAAGFNNKVDGYRRISVDGRRQYLAHRLAWLYMTGEWPAGEVDHLDTDPANTRWDNLRDVTTKVNAQNKRRARVDNKSSGLLGVTWNKDRKKWQAQIGMQDEGGKRVMKSLGRYETKEQAHLVYLSAKRQLHAGCTI